MKKVILIVAVVLVALVGLTSYNGKETTKSNGDDKLIAALKTTRTGEPLKGDVGSDKKKD